MINNISQLYENETVYRPIAEENSVLLEVQLGCSYRKCNFCDFARDEFRVINLERIKQSAKILGKTYPDATNLFLLGQNALCLKTENLIEILSYVAEFMPSIIEVSLYGRVDDINRKGFTGMAELARAGLTTIHVGVESGSDRVLSMMNKGVTSAEMRKAFKLLDNLDISYHVSYILGLGGRALWREHVAQTVRLFNEIHPLSIWALNLIVWPETPLAKMVENAEFEPLTPEQALFEEKLILEQAKLSQCFYMDTTALGEYSIMGFLPDGKEQLLKAINDLLGNFDDEEFLH